MLGTSFLLRDERLFEINEVEILRVNCTGEATTCLKGCLPLQNGGKIFQEETLIRVSTGRLKETINTVESISENRRP